MTLRNGIEIQEERMGTELVKHSNDSSKLSKRLEPSSLAMKAWIAAELASLSILWDRPLSPERLKGYAETLAEYERYQLRTSIRWMKTNWKAADFGFPLPADFIEHLNSDGVEPEIREWKSPITPELVAERAEAENSGELALWWRSLKTKITSIGAVKRSNETKPIKTFPMREMSPVEVAERKHVLKQQAEEAERKFGKQ